MFKLDLRKFKKVSGDEHHTIMRHEAGHEIKLDHSSLAPQLRKELDKLHMAEGGEAKPFHGYNPNKHSKSGGLNDKYREKYNREHGSNLQRPSKDKDNPRHKSFCARMKGVKGPTSKDGKLTPKGAALKRWNCHAEGGEIEQYDEYDVPCTCGADHEAHGGEMRQSNPKLEESKKVPHYAKGGDVEDDMPVSMASEEEEMPSPDVVAPPMAQAPSQAQPEPISLAGSAGEALRVAAGLQQTAPAMQAPQASTMPQTPSVADELSSASSVGALEQQVKGIKAQANAEAALGEGLAAQALERHKQFQDLETRAQKVNDLIDGELKAFIEDRRNDRIQPNQYMANMSTGQKILTGIALGLGGLGQGLAGGANPALEYLNKEIDRDIDAQVKNMNIKESLVTANLKRFGNMQDAIAMSKALMLADAANMADMLKNKSSSQVSKARADQLIGQLKAQIAPQLETLKTKAMLQDMAYGHPMAQGKPTEHGGLIPMDPTSLVPKMVPEKAQKEVFAEVKRAMDTRHISETALKNFDELSQGYQGLGRVTGAVYDPAQKGVLRDVIAQTVGDKTGSVRELAFQEAMHAYMPVPTDTAERAAQKRENFVAYLTSKQSAPTFKAYTGVDIDRFGPTATAESAQAAGKPMGQPQLVEREETASGRKALFDPATKQFVRWK